MSLCGQPLGGDSQGPDRCDLYDVPVVTMKNCRCVMYQCSSSNGLFHRSIHPVCFPSQPKSGKEGGGGGGWNSFYRKWIHAITRDRAERFLVKLFCQNAQLVSPSIHQLALSGTQSTIFTKYEVWGKKRKLVIFFFFSLLLLRLLLFPLQNLQ